MTIKELLEHQGLREEDALAEAALLNACSKLSRYDAECAMFTSRYGKTLSEMKASLAAAKGREDFDAENDVIEWEFATSSAAWIRKQLDETGLSHV